MSTCISLLRGINVTGNKTVKMKSLKELYESLGLREVRTYLQSGNVVFDSVGWSVKELLETIEEKIKQTFGFPVTVLLRTPGEMRRIIENNPFLKEPGIEEERLYVTFLASAPGQSIIDTLDKTQDKNDRFAIAGKEVYLYCPNGYGRTKFSNDFFEKKLKTAATTRNWKTVNALLALSGEEA